MEMTATQAGSCITTLQQVDTAHKCEGNPRADHLTTIGERRRQTRDQGGIPRAYLHTDTNTTTRNKHLPDKEAASLGREVIATMITTMTREAAINARRRRLMTTIRIIEATIEETQRRQKMAEMVAEIPESQQERTPESEWFLAAKAPIATLAEILNRPGKTTMEIVAISKAQLVVGKEEASLISTRRSRHSWASPAEAMQTSLEGTMLAKVSII